LLLLALALAIPCPARAHHLESAKRAPAASGAHDGLPLYAGLGTWHHAVRTRSPMAQRYFDQGLKMLYAFNHDEAIAAFEEAGRLDSTCAMAPWGVALAYGPNINLPIDPDHEKAAYAAIARAQALASHASPIEREYIAALSVRYAKNGDGNRTALDHAYADSMRALASRHPDDADAQVLFAESVMDLAPWHHWSIDGTPHEGTLEIVATLERVLARWPGHPGANHYYIHAVEASPHPEKALPCADRLARLMPGAGHVVHMPAHIYDRTGRYAESEAANRAAAAVDEKYIAARNPQGVYPLMYYSHNLHFLWANLCEEGKSREAVAQSRKVGARVTPEIAAMMPMAEFLPPTPYYTFVRFGRWDDMLAEPSPPVGMRFTSGMYHYARGVALAARGRSDEARAERDSVDEIGDAVPEDLVVGLNGARPLLRVASAVLAGDIAYRAGKLDDAIAGYEQAIKLYDALAYDEPAPWYQSPRELLGKALLDAKRPADAERVYRADLLQRPRLGWALVGLAQALSAQGKTAEAARVQAEFKRAWAGADMELTASRM
jgi:tetratricopeptide (TPR) repeat protein